MPVVVAYILTNVRIFVQKQGIIAIKKPRQNKFAGACYLNKRKILNMLLAFVESHIVDILLNALLLAARTNHQNIVSVHHNIIA